jgi:hypothetical protein
LCRRGKDWRLRVDATARRHATAEGADAQLTQEGELADAAFAVAGTPVGGGAAFEAKAGAARGTKHLASVQVHQLNGAMAMRAEQVHTRNLRRASPDRWPVFSRGQTAEARRKNVVLSTLHESTTDHTDNTDIRVVMNSLVHPETMKMEPLVNERSSDGPYFQSRRII